VTIARVRKREPIQASFELQLQKEKMKQNQEAFSFNRTGKYGTSFLLVFGLVFIFRSDNNLSSGLTRLRIRKRYQKKLDQYDDLRQSAKFNKEELEKMFIDEADAQRVPRTPKQIQETINEILENSMQDSRQPKSELLVSPEQQQPAVVSNGDAQFRRNDQPVAFEATEPPHANLAIGDDDRGGTSATVGSNNLQAVIDTDAAEVPSENGDSPKSVRIEFQNESAPETVLYRAERNNYIDNTDAKWPKLDLIESLRRNDKDESHLPKEDEEETERESDRRARESLPLLREAIKVKLGKIDKTYSGVCVLFCRFPFPFIGFAMSVFIE
jgi:hypothetical protein